MTSRLAGWLVVLAGIALPLGAQADDDRLRPVVELKGHESVIYSLAFSPDGKRLASAANGSENGEAAAEIKLWDLKTRKEVRSLRGHEYGVWDLAFSPDGKRLASGSVDESVRVWDVVGDKPVRAFLGHSESVYGVAWSPDGKWVASCSEVELQERPHGEVLLWDASTRRLRRKLVFSKRWRTFDLAFRPDGKQLATANEHGVDLVDPKNGLVTKSFGERLGHELAAIEYSPDGKRLAAATVDESVRVWDLATGKVLVKADHPNTRTVYQALATVAFSADGKWLASTSGRRKVKVWEVATGKEVLSLDGDKSVITSVAFSPDGKWLAAAGAERVVRLWDVAKLRKVAKSE